MDVLQADAEPQQPIRDARSLPGSGVDEPVREAGGVLDQRVRRPQADGGRHEPHGLHHGRRSRPAADDLEREHGPGPRSWMPSASG